jgi:hypothetical protein
VTLRQVREQKAVEAGDEMGAMIALLEDLPLEGQVIRADVGLLRAPLVQEGVEKGGGYIGLIKVLNRLSTGIKEIKDDQPELRQAMVAWMGPPTARPADWGVVSQGHGRLERRALWLWPCGDRGHYLEERFVWPGAQWCGWIERQRWHQGREETSLLGQPLTEPPECGRISPAVPGRRAGRGTACEQKETP